MLSHIQEPLSDASLKAVTGLLLQKHLLDEDGRPRKAQDGENPHNIGLSLEYIYGSIAFTFKEARDIAKMGIGEQFLS